ncbi:MAG: YceI family protein [Deltaproteobacteria bacterium]|nr:YceI family protein [Deltaproteobacteria bacterium]MBW2402721.1 YceI family protein [Deltaproteobacteria bacterium]
MARFDAYNSECLLFSFKDGLLARLAHDLKLQVERFSIEADDTTHQITATFDPSSIQVVCARIDGRDDRSTLSKGDKKKIYDNVTKDVLRTRKHPEIRFDSTHVVERGDGFSVEGTLQMYGKSRNLQTSVRPDGDRWVAELKLHQPDFGIKPYSAALGALKVKPDILVRVSVPRQS